MLAVSGWKRASVSSAGVPLFRAHESGGDVNHKAKRSSALSIDSRGLALVLVAAVMSLPACTSGGFSIPLDADDIPDCQQDETIQAEDLSTVVNDCNRGGWTVQFPDQTEVEVSRIGSVFSSNSYSSAEGDSGTYTVINLGKLGIIAAYAEPDGRSEWWGPTETLEDWWASEGEDAPMNSEKTSS